MKEKKSCFTKRKVLMTAVFVVGVLVIGVAAFWQKSRKIDREVNNVSEAGDELEELFAADDIEEEEGTEGKEVKVSKVQGVSYPEEKEEEEIDLTYKMNLKPFYKNTIRDTLTSKKRINRVYSPVNLYLCMAMLTEMTDGKSREQLMNAIGQESQEDIRKQSQLIWQSVYQDGDVSQCILGDSVWLNQDISFQKDVLKEISEYYYTEVYQGQMGKGMDKRIQEWVNGITRNQLKKAAGGIKTTDNTFLVLMSATHFFNQWEIPFAEEQTKKDVFRNADGKEVTCDFMNGVRTGEVNQREHFQSTSLRMQRGNTMHLFLPYEGFSVEDLLKDDMDEVLQIMTSPIAYGEEGRVTISLPKFAVSSSLDLIPVLENIGVTDVFHPETADFTRLLGMELEKQPPVYVKKVCQATKAVVDEDGCSVDSFTEVEMGLKGIPSEKEFFLKYDRPFLFIISNYDGIPVFAGVVNQMGE